MSLPTLSTPLKAGIRTTEGILSGVVAGLISVCSVIDPHALPKKEGAIITAGIAVLYGVQRTLLKVVAVQKGLGVGAPIDDQKLDHTMASIVDQATAVNQLVEQHQGIVDDLSKIDFTQLPTKAELEELLSKLESFANQPPAPVPAPEPAPPAVPSDPVADAAVSITPAEEATVQPPAMTPSPIPAPAEPSAAATISPAPPIGDPPPAQPDPVSTGS